MTIMLKHFLFVYICSILALTVLVHAQTQSGFISIDCGIPENSTYTDKATGLIYVSELGFIENQVGVSSTISLEHHSDTLEQQFSTLRSFPQGHKNCYTLRPADGKGNKYLIRARFLYGNYDGKMIVPGFDLYLGTNKWGTVKLDNASITATKEIIYIPSSDYIFVCVVNTGHGTPFISALELRPLSNSTYTPAQAAVLYRRYDVGSKSNSYIRYKEDEYDRIWQPFNFPDRKVLSTSLAIDSKYTQQSFNPPSSVMATAMSPENVTSPYFSFYLKPENPTAQYYVYMYFAELQKLQPNESREFYIYQNGEYFNGDVMPTSLNYLYTTTVYSQSPISGDKIEYDLEQTKTSTHQPILNALEVYIVQNFSESQTHDQDVGAMMNIKSKYGVSKNWQGDPCAPKTYTWDGLNCSYNGKDPVRIISLNLSSSGLTGKIPSYITDLTMIQFLDLSNNSLTGTVPDFLSKLQSLSFLDLRGNNLTGSVPVNLIERSNNGSLLLSVTGNPQLCSIVSCYKQEKHKNYNVSIIVSVASLFVLLVALFIGWRLLKRRKIDKYKAMNNIGSELERKKHQFTYSEITSITNNFEKVIGKGGFGPVYYGYLNDNQVAIKMLSDVSEQGYKEFRSEVLLLMRVHHRNLTSLIGYCIEDNCMGLIYEYMANGNLKQHLSEKNTCILSWEDRLKIAVDAAQGLEYLHHGCKPPIIHRDVKTPNILLNEKFEAKLADFGLSRAFPIEGGTHVSTVVAGTPGYLDPEYFQSNWLNEKSDIFSFGVVLLEIITSRPVLARDSDNENIHVSQWVEFMVGKGEIESIVDPRLQGEFQVNSAWKYVEIATACVSLNSSERPTMTQVVMELNECLSLAIDKDDPLPKTMNSLNVDTDINPSPR